MKTALLAAAATALLAAAPLHAADDAMQAARQDLQAAHDHLKAAPSDYAGHRKQALDLVARALTQVEQGLKVSERHDAQQEKKVKQLEHKQEKLGTRIDKMKGENAE